MTQRRGAWVALGSSTVISSIAAWLVLSPRQVPSVVLAESTNAVAELLDSRRVPEPRPVGGDPWPPPLEREVLDEDAAAILYPQIDGRRFVYDSLAHFRPVHFSSRWRRWDEHPAGGWKVHQNSLGMRGMREPLEDPDVRVLVVGDSHSFGLCADDETFAHLAERALARERPDDDVEVLNASAGGYDPFNYLGVVERYRELAPDVVVVVLYGGNDFSGVMSLERYFHRRGRPVFREEEVALLQRSDESARVGIAQMVGQILYFRKNRADVDVASATLASIALELEQACAQIDSRLVCAYLPPPGSVQARAYADVVEPLAREFELDASELELPDRLADAWLAFLAERGIATLDLRPVLDASAEGCYWREDLHLNLRGHELVALALGERLESLLD